MKNKLNIKPHEICSKCISVKSGKTSNCFSKMMMAAGAESPSVATQSAKTDILQKIGQRGNNHQENETALGKIRNEHVWTCLTPSKIVWNVSKLGQNCPKLV